MTYLFSAIGGFALEFSSVFWTHFSERGDRKRLTLVSAGQALALSIGVGDSQTDWLHRAVFALGYAIGANAGCAIAKRKP